MSVNELQPGDIVYSAKPLYNDGSIPGLPEQTLIADTGTRGVIINIGHLEDQPNKTLYLIRFEQDNAELGPPVGCWPDELREPEDTAGR